jgi:riboflavin kinase/FMN adenylyltransferase
LALVDEVIVRDWSEIQDLPPEAFVREELMRELGARGVVVGPDHRFGHRAAGDVALLLRLGQATGLSVLVVEPLRIGGEVVSAKRIRTLVRAGRVKEATALLGRPPVLFANPVRGAGLARKLGYPTINLEPWEGLVRPGFGVYLAWAYWASAEGGSPALFYIGNRPTFPDLPPTAELHLLEQARCLPYFEQASSMAGILPALFEVEVHLLEFLRRDERFPSAQALAQQIAHDRAEAERRLAMLPQPKPVMRNKP